MDEQENQTEEGAPGKVAPGILSVKGLLLQEGLAIPNYQRPYKWTTQHVQTLFSDISRHRRKSVYRLGTIVFHREGASHYIVDGQQRTITLLLTLLELLAITDRGERQIESPNLAMSLDELREPLKALSESLRFPSDVSQRNILQNRLTISRLVSHSDFTEELIGFLLNRCQMVTFTLTNLSEAFQFFDSQNARGRDLAPHDLLKAYHLREFGLDDGNSSLMTRTIEQWENLDPAKLAHFFENYWFRIRQWSEGKSARYFGKDDVGLFKGVSLGDGSRYPYAQGLRVLHFFTDHHRAQYERSIDSHEQPFPFQFDQVILNGRRFFEMASHYLKMAQQFTDDADLAEEKDEDSGPVARLAEMLPDAQANAKAILKELQAYEGRHRTGDMYVRTLFDCLLLAYIDRFGLVEIAGAIEKIFIWAYSLRLGQQRVQLASMDKQAILPGLDLFQELRRAIRPEQFLDLELQKLGSLQFESKMGKIPDLFRDMKFLA